MEKSALPRTAAWLGGFSAAAGTVGTSAVFVGIGRALCPEMGIA